VVDGIPTTTVARTLIDLGAVTTLRRVEHATDAAERDQLVSRRALVSRHRALRARGRNGIATFAAVLEAREVVIPESVMERRFVRILEQAHLPAPALQYSVPLGDGRSARVDAAYPHLRLGFEIDGHRWHASRAQRAADNRRANDLANLGWDVRRFTADQIVGEPARVADAVRIAISRRSGDTR